MPNLYSGPDLINISEADEHAFQAAFLNSAYVQVTYPYASPTTNIARWFWDRALTYARQEK